MAAGWININTIATTSTPTATVGMWNPTSATSTFYYQNNATYYQNNEAVPRALSAAEMIYKLEGAGHVVLQKKQHAVMRGVPLWDMERYDPDNPAGHTTAIHYGYALPERDGDYLMPDGSTLKVDRYGNYQVLDQDAKVTYKANRIREFSRYLNASDLLEAFIKEVGCLDGVNQNEILRLPIEAFINWLILQAATKDGDSLDGLPSVEKALPAPIPKKPRCLSCGRFMSKAWAAARVEFCSQEHWAAHQRRLTHVRDGAPLLRAP